MSQSAQQITNDVKFLYQAEKGKKDNSKEINSVICSLIIIFFQKERKRVFQETKRLQRNKFCHRRIEVCICWIKNVLTFIFKYKP